MDADIFFSTYTLLALHVWLVVQRLGVNTDADSREFKQRFYAHFANDVERRVHRAGVQVGVEYCLLKCGVLKCEPRILPGERRLVHCLAQYSAGSGHRQVGHATLCGLMYVAACMACTDSTRRLSAGRQVPSPPMHETLFDPHLKPFMQVGVGKWLKQLETVFYTSGIALDRVLSGESKDTFTEVILTHYFGADPSKKAQVQKSSGAIYIGDLKPAGQFQTCQNPHVCRWGGSRFYMFTMFNVQTSCMHAHFAGCFKPEKKT